SSSVKRGCPYRAWISSSLRILSRFCVGWGVGSCKGHPPLNRSPTPIDVVQKVDLLHHTRCRVPLYVSLADCQIVLDIMKHKDEAMALVGYARVSSVGQRLDVQVAKLQHCDKLFQEHI